jgi:D-sedoheptulose 7-phosphate isomerase
MDYLEELLERYPVLVPCRGDIQAALRALTDCFGAGGKLLVCGNGGSAADSDHIVAELMKGFMRLRPLPEDFRRRLCAVDPVLGTTLAAKLQGALPTINITTLTAVSSAFANDVSAELAYAQAVNGYGKPGDILLGISTSGNAANVRSALCVARARGMKTIGLSGKGGGKMAALCDILIAVPATRTFEIQELHLPVYHCLCATLEAHFFT